MRRPPAPRMALGKAYLRAGRVDEGLAELKRIMEKAPAFWERGEE